MYIYLSIYLSLSLSLSHLSLLLGLIPDYDGKCQIFGTEVLQAHRPELANCLAYAPQEPFMMTGTLRENLTCVANALGKITPS